MIGHLMRTPTYAFSLLGRKHQLTLSYPLGQSLAFAGLPTAQGSSPAVRERGNVSRLLLGCMFSRILGNSFPLAIYLSQSVEFCGDVRAGEEVKGEVEVVKDLGRNRYEVRTTAWRTDGRLLMQGTAVILQE